MRGLSRNSPRSCGIPHARENSECEIRKLESGPITLLIRFAEKFWRVERKK